MLQEGESLFIQNKDTDNGEIVELQSVKITPEMRNEIYQNRLSLLSKEQSEF